MMLVSTLLILAVMPGMAYLLLLTLASLRRLPSVAGIVPMAGRLAIIVPAHDEAMSIAPTLENLSALAGADGDAELVVVADNCTDDTAVIARAHGARVLERHDPNLRGKGYALDFAFRSLAGDGFAAYLIIDADTLAEAGLLATVRRHFAAGADVVQVRYTVLNATQSPGTRLAELALSAFNCLRPHGRTALGCSAGILGNGFALRSRVIEQVPYAASSVVEDLEYHLHLLDRGLRVVFADETAVRGEMPVSAAAQQTQRARWEGGRLRMLITHGPVLLRKIWAGQGRFIEPLFELLLPPLAYQSLLLCLLLAWPSSATRLCGVIGMAILGLHVLIAARIAGLSMTQLAGIIAHVPCYLFWKLSLLKKIVRAAHHSAHWIRTGRNPS